MLSDREIVLDYVDANSNEGENQGAEFQVVHHLHVKVSQSAILALLLISFLEGLKVSQLSNDFSLVHLSGISSHFLLAWLTKTIN